jgi:small nuclear ribonucleoprotein (snRNP)-like protein
VEGVLKGYDPLLNLVLDETKEFLRGAARAFREDLAACKHHVHHVLQ